MIKYSKAINYLLLAYITVTIGAGAAYFVSETAMWITAFTFGPVVFGYFFYIYLRKVKPVVNNITQVTNRLILLWIVLSFMFDAVVYIAIFPLISGHIPNWTFFIDQSPWIWLNYFTIVILGHVSRLIYSRKFLKN